MIGLMSCSTAKKNQGADQIYGPEPIEIKKPAEEIPGPQPLPNPTASPTVLDEYGPSAQTKNEAGIVVIFGKFLKNPATVMGAVRQLEAEGIQIKKMLALEVSATILGIHVASKSQNKADWDLTQVYKELEKNDKKDLQKKLTQIFQNKANTKTGLEFIFASQPQLGWSLSDSAPLVDRMIEATKACGWIDEMREKCTQAVTKDQYLELVKKINSNTTLVVQSEIPTEKTDNGVIFVQIPELVGVGLDSVSRSKHLFHGKKVIKQESEKIKAWLKEIKEKNGQS